MDEVPLYCGVLVGRASLRDELLTAFHPSIRIADDTPSIKTNRVAVVAVLAYSFFHFFYWIFLGLGFEGCCHHSIHQ